MHELSLVAELINRVNQDAAERGSRPVESVTVAVGSRSHLEPDSLQHVFNLAKEGTLLRNAVLVIERKEGEGLEIVEYYTRD